MFTQFFYYLKAKGLNVSLNEWMVLIEGLNKGLANASFMGFYQLCRTVLIKNEADYDKFDVAFATYFKKIKPYEEIPNEFWEWLDKEEVEEIEYDQYELGFNKLSIDELNKKFEERLEEQKEEHNGGTYWVGTGGASVFGHSGNNPNAIRVGGKSTRKNALKVAGERNYKDFREDKALDIRQFQMAFRKLRQYSSKIDVPKTELDLDQTIEETCNNAGSLKIVWDRPRKNTVKLLLLIDSDGSMLPYMNLCNQLFQSVSRSNHFKDLKVLYFHNCIYEKLYTDPTCRRGRWVDTEWVMKNYGSDYKLIIVGDGSMAPIELMSKGGNNAVGLYNKTPGIDWLERLKKFYKNNIWLNPVPKRDWPYSYGYFTIKRIMQTFPMYDLTLDGLEKGIKKLLNPKS